LLGTNFCILPGAEAPASPGASFYLARPTVGCQSIKAIPAVCVFRHASAPSLTTDYAEKVRSQFLSLRHCGQRGVFSGLIDEQFNPVFAAISDLASVPWLGRILVFLSETPIYLRTCGLRSFSTVLEIAMFRGAYEVS